MGHTDDFLTGGNCPHAGEWSSYQTRICMFLDLPIIPEPVWQRWFYKLYDYLVDIR
jgi:hypothetical protein